MDEDDPKTGDAFGKKMQFKSLLIDAPDREKEGASSSKEDEKKEKDSPPSTSRMSPSCSESKNISPPPTPPRASPEPSCAICLEHLTNKSFTNSCFHMFCFTCLVEWSKVKPECPLCKQSFTSIVHNVKSFQEYDQYHISSSSRTPDPLWHMDRTFRYRTTMTPGRFRLALPDTRIETEMTSHRMRYAPHSVNHLNMFGHQSLPRHMPCVYRRRIYQDSLWAEPTSGDRVRCASPAFFQRNIACTHRLLPWLNRELLVVMPHNEAMIPFVLELIMALIVKYSITSPEFYSHIEPYIAPYTSHFIHEFYNFAISPYDMESYDYRAVYNVMPSETIRLSSSPDSDVVALASTSTSTHPSSSKSSKSDPRKKSRQSRKNKMSEYKRRLEKLILKRNSTNNCWENVGRLQLNNGDEVPNSNPFELPGPSTSWNNILAGATSSTEDSTQEIDVGNEIECVPDEECLIVDVLKPKSERTPEIVHLSSGEEDFTTTTEVTSTVQDKVPSIIDISDGTTTSDDEDIVILSIKPNVSRIQEPDTSHLPIDYSLKNLDQPNNIQSKPTDLTPMPGFSKNMRAFRMVRPRKKFNKHKKDIGSEKDSGPKSDLESKKDSEEINEPESKIDPEPRKDLESKKNLILRSAVRVLSNDNDSHSDSWSPLTKPRKRRAMILDDSSTESCSESAQVSEIDSRIKKLKLRSVVAHFSFDQSDEKNDSIRHSSSHKRHKDKRKKKKKHKHRRRIYSSDST